MSGAGPADDPELVRRLRAAGCVFAEDEARLITAATDDPTERARLVAARVAGLPLEQVLGWAEFDGLRIVLEPGVFVPRRRTGLMVAEAAALGLAVVGRPVVVVDLCCGSGAVGAAVHARLAGAGRALELLAADLDPAAVRCARRNLPPGCRVLVSDLFADLPDDLRGRVDVLCANVPYVPSDAVALMPREAREHEPRTALDGGSDGLVVLRRLVAGAPAWLAPGGSVLVETSEAQQPAASAALRAAGLLARAVHDDERGATVLVGTRGAEDGRAAGRSGPERRPG